MSRFRYSDISEFRDFAISHFDILRFGIVGFRAPEIPTIRAIGAMRFRSFEITRHVASGTAMSRLRCREASIYRDFAIVILRCFGIAKFRIPDTPCFSRFQDFRSSRFWILMGGARFRGSRFRDFDISGFRDTPAHTTARPSGMIFPDIWPIPIRD